jgi:sporulation protein YlmC with PRC-barrel domain
MKEISISELLGKRVVDSEGQPVGRIHEIRVERGDEFCPVEAYIVGKRAVLQRLASWAVPSHIGQMIESRIAKGFGIAWNQMDLSDPEHPRTTVPKKDLSRAR